MSEIENNTNTNDIENDEKMAVKFPDWDLLPPDLLIRRPQNEN